MASSPITSWQIDGKAVETVTDFIFLASKITADGYCTHEIKKTLAPWKKSYDQLATHSTILFRESCGQRSLVGCRLWGHRVGHN